MKKALLVSLTTLLALGAYAQKKGSKVSSNTTIELKTKTDSLAYALGQSITNGLEQYIETTGILKDTTKSALIENYNEKFSKGSQAEKDKLEKEYQKQLAETKKANEEAYNTFLQGLQEALSADANKRSYHTGIAIGSQLATTPEAFEKQMLGDEKINKHIYASSVIAAIKKQPSIIPNVTEYFQAEMEQLQRTSQERASREQEEQREKRMSEEVNFLSENKKNDGVVSLPNGLQYKVLVKGEGEIPAENSRVTVHYEGRLLDGTIFDSSYRRGEPATFGVTQVIKGWTETLQMMPKGSKWTVYVPYKLAYGENGSGAIPPFSTLVFDIELIDIN